MCPRRAHSQRLIHPRHQSGAVLLIMLVILIVGATAMLLRSLSSTTMRMERDKITANALAQAKEALIGYAASHPTLPGSLLCPDINNDGSSDISGQNCTAYIGRFPWQQLKLPDLRDGNGDCLWYALSPVFRNVFPASSRSPLVFPLNSNTLGQLNVFDNAGIQLPFPPNPVIAIIFSPGAPLNSQDRAATAGPSTVCGGNNNANNYLDSASGINNATGGGTATSFIAADMSATFNDKLLYITASQFFPSINKRVAAEIRGLDQPPTSGLRQYYVTNHYYPCAANAGSAGASVTTPSCLTSGLVPNVDLASTYPLATKTWLTNNDWFSVSSYAVAPNFQQSTITIYPQQCGAGGVGCLTVNNYGNSQAQITTGGLSAIVCTINGTVTSCPYP